MDAFLDHIILFLFSFLKIARNIYIPKSLKNSMSLDVVDIATYSSTFLSSEKSKGQVAYDIAW